MKSKIILLAVVLGMGLINQPTQTASCPFLKSITPSCAKLKNIGIVVGMATATVVLTDLIVTKFYHIARINQNSADNQARMQISDQIYALYGEKLRLDMKYGWSGINYGEEIKEFFARNPELIFKQCVVSQNGSFVTPVEFFTNNDEHELVTFLLNLQCHVKEQ